MNILITGVGGLVGSSCVKIMREGNNIIGIDNDTRGKLWEDGATSSNIDRVRDEYDIDILTYDIRDMRDDIEYISAIVWADGIIHTAAQPSHPYSVDNPEVDFSINAVGTFNLLNLCRKYNPNVVFITCSSNKVYGDKPNEVPYVELSSRYDYDLNTNTIPGVSSDGINENHPIDNSLHTPFGVSKVAADLYTQEFGRLYGMKTGVFRMGCITGSAAKAVEQHNWIPHFVKTITSGDTLKIFGYGGKQVRDIIHADDLARLFKIYIENPKCGEYYNIGGGKDNSISLLECIEYISNNTGHVDVDIEYHPEREGDHRIYYTDMGKIHRDYPEWRISRSVTSIVDEIVEAMTL